MDHLAIMKKSWGLTEKIIQGKKRIESRWYSSKRAPWDKIKRRETVYFKDSGNPVKLKAKVKKVLQFSDLTPRKVKLLFKKYAKADGIEKKEEKHFFSLFKGKKYCILIFLQNPQRIKPFNVSKKGFGNMSAWLTVKNIKTIKI